MTLYQKLASILPDAGLTEAETRLYIELLKSPSQTVWQLVDRTGLNRCAVYRAFERLQSLKMVSKGTEGIRARSLKGLVAEITASNRKLRKSMLKLKELDPLLKTQADTVEQFDVLHTPDQIADAFMFLSDQDRDTNLDLGDFESFIALVGGVPLASSFRDKRTKKGIRNHSLLTTSGPYTSYFCTDEDETKYHSTMDVNRKINIQKHFTVFSDTGDYVLFNDCSEEGEISSVLVKSKAVADTQRLQFRTISQWVENQ